MVDTDAIADDCSLFACFDAATVHAGLSFCAALATRAAISHVCLRIHAAAFATSRSFGTLTDALDARFCLAAGLIACTAVCSVRLEIDAEGPASLEIPTIAGTVAIRRRCGVGA